MSRSPSPRRGRSRSRSRSLSRSPSRSPSLSPGPEEDDACPFLIRIFVTKGKHTSLRDFDANRLPLSDEFHVYGSKSSTPTSLIQQLYAILPPPYRSPVARYSFKHVYVDATEHGLYKAKDIVSFSGYDFVATVAPGSEPGRGRKVDEDDLDRIGFIKGDLLSVAVNVPEPRDRDRDRERTNGAARPKEDAFRSRNPPPARFERGWQRERDRDAPRLPAGGRRESHDRWPRRSRSRSPGWRRDSRDSWRARD